MRIFIDADACPVVNLTLRLSREYKIPVTLVCDAAHAFSGVEAEVITVSQGADSADFALVNRVCPRDIVVTQDYGLAAMCLARKARVLNQNGLIYSGQNMDSLLLARHTAQKIRRGGGRLKGPKKRTPQQDRDFEAALRRLLETGKKE